MKHESQEIRLLGIDTDDSENNKFPELPPLGESELALLDSETAVRTMAQAAANMPQAAHVLDYLPVEQEQMGNVHQWVRGKIQQNKGAGQFRRAGKLLFNSNVSDGANLNKRVQDIRNELTGLHARIIRTVEGIQIERGTRVYVVSSLAGGTGAGCLIDMLALIRRHFDDQNDTVTAVCLLPGQALDVELTDPRREKLNTRGNAVAILKELQGFMLGQFRSHTFEFDAHTRLALGNNNLVNNVYLVGDKQWSGAQVDRWIDLCQAASYFLYGILGTGVGASKQAGAVNHDVSVESRTAAHPSLFSSLGVGVVEYPINEIGAFAFRATAQKVMDGWLDKTSSKTGASKQLDSLKSSLGVWSLEELVGSFGFNSSTVAEARFLRSGTPARKKAMWRDDDWFVGKAESVVESIDGHLAAYDGQLAEHAAGLARSFGEVLAGRIRAMMTENHHAAVAVAEAMINHVEELSREFSEEANRRAKDTKDVLKRMEQLKRSVHRLDGGLDIVFGKRQGLIEQVNRYLVLRVEARLEAHLAGLLNEYGRLARNVLNEAVTVRADLQNLHRANQAQIEELSRRVHRPGFVQHAMAIADIPNWVDSLSFSLGKSFAPSEFRAEALLRQALAGVEEVIRAGLVSLNLSADAKKKNDAGKRLLGMLKALEDASKPLMKLVETAPGISDLKPQDFVASLNVEDVVGLYKPSGGGKLDPVDITNQHLVLYIRTIHEFAMQHWDEFEAAAEAYAKKPWYYHALPDSVTIPSV
ncbi:MAG TPA: tubulin-like doman-containing protein [Kiritimatiellia bacterium]|nr:tubulin-like doman-containing protein [Kiritimatiellia bacterium]